jgi:hypothetical protein
MYSILHIYSQLFPVSVVNLVIDIILFFDPHCNSPSPPHGFAPVKNSGIELGLLGPSHIRLRSENELFSLM